jgi:hypothetical protein
MPQIFGGGTGYEEHVGSHSIKKLRIVLAVAPHKMELEKGHRG